MFSRHEAVYARGLAAWGRRIVGVLFAAGLVATSVLPGFSAEARVLTIDAFAALAAQHDTEFQSILLDELALQYAHRLRLPARDLVLEVKQDYVSFLEDSRGDAATKIGLGKLFPFTGTKLDVTYEARPVADAAADTPSNIGVSLAQPIARNAFGRSTRMLDRIIGLEVDVAKHQVVEAYEDYLATVMVAYYQWWAAHEDLAIGVSSYRENLRLLDNMLERQKQQVALPIDVNKTRIQLLGKKESLVGLNAAYSNALHVVARVVRHDGVTALVPSESAPLPFPEAAFPEVFDDVRASSRTFQVLALLEARSGVDVDRAADALLPSIDLLFGIDVEGRDHEVRDGESVISVGLGFQWPIPNEVAKAEHEVAKIELTRAQLETENTYFRLQERLQNLHVQIVRERELKAIAEEKIELARAVLNDETENYSFGRVTLNDYIQAVNTLDNSRFSRLRHDVQEKILIVEWLRLTDQLISRDAIGGR